MTRLTANRFYLNTESKLYVGNKIITQEASPTDKNLIVNHFDIYKRIWNASRTQLLD